jgi:hypothetical protein
VADRRRRILRFIGPRGDLLAAEAPNIIVYDAAGNERFRAEVEDFLDIAQIGDELWVAGAAGLIRLSIRDGRPLGSEPLDYLDPAGRFLVSATCPTLPVWHATQPVAVRTGPGRTEVPGPGGDLMLPIADGRWLLWQAGQLRLWRSIGEAWRKPLGDPGTRAFDAQLVLEGRLFVLAQQRAPRAGEAAGELRLTVAAVTDGAQQTQVRVPQAAGLAFAARRGFAAVRVGDRLCVFDLRFGRWLRDLVLPPGTTEIAVDEGLQRIALGSPSGLEIVRPDALAAPPSEPADPPAADDAEVPAGATPSNGHDPEGVGAVEVSSGSEHERPPEQPVPSVEQPDEALPEAPLVRLDPVAIAPLATAAEIMQTLDMRLALVGARVHFAIAEAWDCGRIAKPDATRPPFYDEVAGLLRLGHGHSPNELAAAVSRHHAIEDTVLAAERARSGRLVPFDALARDFQLSPLAASMLFTIAAPRLRGELARLYGILANDPARSLTDEHLLGLIIGAGHATQIARELDGDRPLRKYGLVRVGAGDRPFAALSADPFVVRAIANQSADGEPDPYLRVRKADRALDELQLPRALIAKALRFLASPRDGEPVRMVVRGRTGSGRHTLLASLASRAGRSLGIIDLALMPHDDGRLAEMLTSLLRRAMLCGLVPCVDGLELIGSENPDTKIQLAAAVRGHPGPLAVRLAAEAQIPLDPGYVLLDVPARNEQKRVESWALALGRHRIDLPDASELAARYRVGPGIIERVCAEVSRRPERPADASSWVRELDDAVRQHLENRLGTTAQRVTRLATWADVVLPEDIIDSLLELTARVRHRKKVYEQWGFDRSITTARGITALFQGSPGTGKTMVAGVIARDLGLEVYRVDVSRITSKWIGETEKNLGALFDAAEDGQVMLLFDEADSLFAKRTEVKTSVDRYSNMEVNYLLQRLDSFEGIAILTTNFGNAIDPAFKRRLTYRVTFPFPDEEMREQLWRSLIPSQVPVQGRLDFASLSQRFRLSGGYIRNAALRAAFLAAEEGTALTHEHLERAIRMEFREIGKLAETGTLE